MKTKNTMHRPILLASYVALAMTVQSRLSAQVQILDNFNSGNITVSNSVSSTFGNPVPGVFGGNRGILLDKATESSATSVTVGGGVLTWNETSPGDFASVIYGTATTLINISGYNAFRITVDSTPQTAGQLEINYFYYGSPTHLYGVNAYATLPSSGTVDIPFASFVSNAGFPPIDFTQAHAIGLTFRGNLLGQGAYVFDNFQAVVVPEPSTIALLACGILGVGLTCRFKARHKHIENHAA